MSTQIQYVRDLANRVAQDPQLANEIKQDPEAALARIAEPPLPDTTVYKIVVSALGLAVLIALVGAIILLAQKERPDLAVLSAIGSAAVGALAGLLAPSPARG
jgi:hypothetical protein